MSVSNSGNITAAASTYSSGGYDVLVRNQGSGTFEKAPNGFINNSTSAQSSANYNIDGVGKVGTLVANGGTDNGVDKIQSGGGSVLGNLFRMEGKIQNTSTTVDATATVWNDATNGSTVTYTLPGTSGLTGGLFMFIKTGTGNLTLSGTIVTKTGASVGSLVLTSADGLQSLWFNGAIWYQKN